MTILEGKTHGGNYQARELWNYLEFLDTWFKDHAPDGATPLPTNVTSSAARGNLWEEVIRFAGRQAALDRQATPNSTVVGPKKRTVEASPGRWDPGMKLEGQWYVDGKPKGRAFKVVQNRKVKYVLPRRARHAKVSFSVTGRKTGYVDETRRSDTVVVGV